MRSQIRIDTIKARFVFEGKSYDVVDISAGSMLIECAGGFEDEIVRRLSSGSFEFRLRDPASGSDIEFSGKIVRCERAEGTDRVVRIGLVFKNKQECIRPVRHDAGRSLSPGRRKTIVLGGGKGGVGKTIISINLALALSEMHKRVTIFDGDFGNGNCNTLLGITRVEKTLEEYLRRECTFDDITVSTAYPGLSLVCGAQNKVDSLLATESQRMQDDIRLIDADCLVIDLGAGISDETLELYRIADEKIIIVTPQFTALQNAYGFVKSAFYHDLERISSLAALMDAAGTDLLKLYSLVSALENGNIARRRFEDLLARHRFMVVGNMVNGDKDLKIIQNFQKVVKEYLHVDSTVLGTIATNSDILNSVNRITPFVALDPDLPHSREMKWMAARLLKGHI